MRRRSFLEACERNHASFRHLTVSAALTLTVLAPVAACGAEPVSPLPIEPLGTSAPATSPATSPTPYVPSPSATVRGPTGAASPDVFRSPACLGSVVYTLVAESELALVKSICLAVGGILRVEGTGPGTVSADPADKVSQFYEAGIVEVRFLSPGTITVTIDRDQQTFTIAVVVK
jgi:hypothetical protein